MIRNFLDCCTSHVSKETADWLDARGSETAGRDGSNRAYVGTTPYGWFVYADTEAGKAECFPDDLVTVFAHATGKGCEYILLDRDADTIDGLPVFEW
jgi:hypothetical protein